MLRLAKYWRNINELLVFNVNYRWSAGGLYVDQQYS